MKDAPSGPYYGFATAILGIFVVVAPMLRSYTQALIILFTIPFGLIGAVLGHLILGVDFSLMSIFGIVALSGIVVNDGLMLIERANKNLVLGMSFFQAVHQAGLRRFRAIVLTTVSTVGGLAPLILETSPQAAILIPMALSVSAGLVFATFLTLVLVPCMMAVLSDMRLAWHGMVKKNMKIKRQALEPAQRRRVLPDITGRRNEGIPSGSLS